MAKDSNDQLYFSKFHHFLSKRLLLKRLLSSHRVHVNQVELRILRPLEEVVITYVSRRIVNLI